MNTRLLTPVLLLAAATLCCAAPGELDLTFDTDGKVTTSIGSSGETIYAMVLQPDGKIVSAGETWNGTKWNLGLTRHTPSGALDPTFGSGGKVSVAVGSSTDYVGAVALQADGKIVVAGGSYNGTNYDIAVARFTAAGVLDNTFGTGGKVISAISGANEGAYGVVIQPDGRIVIAGFSNSGNDRFALVRYLPDGTLDSSFGTGGVVTTHFGHGHDVANGLTLQADGKLVAAGYAFNGTKRNFAAARYTAAGALDPTFGTGGLVSIPLRSGTDEAYALKLLPDGRMVLAGRSFGLSNYDFGLVMLLPDGTLDTTFGGTGIVTSSLNTGDNTAYAVTVLGDGRIVAAGETRIGTGTRDIGVMRYLADGTPDAGFGVDGVVRTGIGSSNDVGYAAALQADGKLVVGGYTWNGTNRDFALVRYEMAATAPVVTYLPHIGLLPTKVTLRGKVNPGGISSTARFEYGLTTGYGSQTEVEILPQGTMPVLMSEVLTGLAPAQTYHYRLVGENVLGSTAGPDMTFTTPLVCADQPYFVETFNSSPVDPGRFTLAVTGGAQGLVNTVAGANVLEYRVPTPDPNGDEMTLALVPGKCPDTRSNWSIVVDLVNKTVPESGQHSSLGLVLRNAADPRDEILVEFQQLPATATFPNGMTKLVCDMSVDGVIVPESERQFNLLGRFDSIGLRFSYLADEGVILVRFDRFGLEETIGEFTWETLAAYGIAGGDGTPATEWNMYSPGTDRFAVEAYAFTENLAVLPWQMGIDVFEISASGVDDVGVVKRRLHQQRNADTVTPDEDARYEFEAYIEGDCLTPQFPNPIGYNLVHHPYGQPLNLNFAHDRWEFVDTEASLPAFDARYPNSVMNAQIYTFRIGGQDLEGFPLSFVGSNGGYLPAPVVTPNAGAWVQGRLRLTAAEAQSGLTLTTNEVFTKGYLTLEIFNETTDVFSKTDYYIGPGYELRHMSATVPPGALVPGNTYTVEAEFDANSGAWILAGHTWATPSAQARSIWSTRTTLEIEVMQPPQVIFNNLVVLAGLTGNNATPNATPFNDGVQNLLKFGFNMNLSGPDAATMAPGGSGGLPGITTQPNGPSSIFRFEFVRRIGSGLIYTPQKSPDITNPASWVPLTDTPTIIPIDATWERVIYEEPYDAAITPKCFGRVHVTLPP